ncbi:MAG: hypothetical protein ACXVR1_16085 [Solirubrobacteraceae bacterium]
MTLALITNIVFAALVLLVIPGMLAWAIRTSRNDGTHRVRTARRPMPHPSFPGPRMRASRPSPRRPASDGASR